ncbi:hypothetical protein G6F57_014312 [Rhizopus arrhizus]|nr:hypothetical protein G6F57_014312 [Rhizopus arrhizus]
MAGPSRPNSDKRLFWLTKGSLFAADHGDEAARNQRHHHQMDCHERHQQRHGEEMDAARKFIAAQQVAQPIELHRLPQHQPGQHQHHDVGHDEQVRQFLHLVVVAQVVVGELAAQRGAQVRGPAAGADGEELAPEAAGGHVQRQIQQAVGEQQPHAGEVPLQGAAQPAAQRDAVGEGEVEERGGVIDAPAANHHDHDG